MASRTVAFIRWILSDMHVGTQLLACALLFLPSIDSAQADEESRKLEILLSEADSALSRPSILQADIPRYKLIQTAGRLRAKLVFAAPGLLESEVIATSTIGLCAGLSGDALPPNVTTVEYAKIIQPIIAASLSRDAHPLTRQNFGELPRWHQNSIYDYLGCLRRLHQILTGQTNNALAAMSEVAFQDGLREIRELRIAVRDSSPANRAWDIVHKAYPDPSLALAKAQRLEELVRTIYFSGLPPTGDGAKNFEYQIAKFGIAEAQAALGNFGEAEQALSALNISIDELRAVGARKVDWDKLDKTAGRLQLLSEVQEAQGKYAESERTKANLTELGRLRSTDGHTGKFELRSFVYWQTARAQAYVRSGDYAGAELLLKGLLDERQLTREWEAHVRLVRAKLLRTVGRHDEALKELLDLGRFVTLGTRTPFYEFIEFLGDELLRKGEDKAVQEFLVATRRTVAAFRPAPNPFDRRAYCHAEMALSLVEVKWLRSGRKFEEAELMLQAAKAAAKCWQENSERFQRASQIDPVNIEEANLKLDMGHPEVALSQYRAGLAQVESIRSRGFREEYERYIELVSGFSRASLQSGNAREAAELLDRAVSPLTGALHRNEADLKQSLFEGRGASSQLLRLAMLSQFQMAISEPDKAGLHSEQAFRFAQFMANTEAQRAIQKMVARMSSADATLESLVRSRESLLKEASLQDNPSSNLIAKLLQLNGRIATEYPSYVEAASTKALSIAEVGELLGSNEAMVVIADAGSELGQREASLLWVITHSESRLVKLEIGGGALDEKVDSLRCGLDRQTGWHWSDETQRWKGRKPSCVSLRPDGLAQNEPLPFDVGASYDLYKALFGSIEDLVRNKQLLIVPTRALNILPFQVLVTADPAGDAGGAGAQWLASRHAITVLPSVSSLAALRRNAKTSMAGEPFIGFGNPVLDGHPGCGKIVVPDKCPEQETKVSTAPSFGDRVNTVLASLQGLFRDGQADVTAVRTLCPLPDTAHELKCVARSLGAKSDSIVLGPAMTETTIKSLKLQNYRIVHFATHGLLAGETEQLANGRAEPALVMTPPQTASETDDGLLTASEVAGLKLDADWVVMSACNTAGADKPGAEALSGLAKAFFYAGARALLVSHWPVNSYAATMLTSTTFVELKREPKIGRAEAFRRAMVALINNKDRPWAAHPSVWAPFVVVGEGGAG
ncbi:MAG: hypothetical protein CTY20_04335 [Hyphomicrobium sp.]|nr:MAG: hypothetical protein CTY20_04335 [Hyphomicrobium sp.]